MLDTEQAGISQDMELDPEMKAGVLMDILEIVLGDLIAQGKDIPLAQLQDLRFSFAEDGSVKVAVVSAPAPDAGPDAQPAEDITEVSGDKIELALQEAAADLQIEDQGSLDA